MMIPSRMVRQWDFKQYPVANVCADYLSNIYEQPVICISALDPVLVEKNPLLTRLRSLRTVLSYMYDYIKGTLEELSPAEAVVECHGIGFKLQISLNTYDRLQGQKEVRLYVHHHLREDEETLYGFCDKEERRIFALLIGVSGIGPNTARMMLTVQIRRQEEPKREEVAKPTATSADGTDTKRPVRNSGKKPGRNDPCPCGSGLKYKKCCGKNE